MPGPIPPCIMPGPIPPCIMPGPIPPCIMPASIPPCIMPGPITALHHAGAHATGHSERLFCLLTSLVMMGTVIRCRRLLALLLRQGHRTHDRKRDQRHAELHELLRITVLLHPRLRLRDCPQRNHVAA